MEFLLGRQASLFFSYPRDLNLGSSLLFGFPFPRDLDSGRTPLLRSSFPFRSFQCQMNFAHILHRLVRQVPRKGHNIKGNHVTGKPPFRAGSFAPVASLNGFKSVSMLHDRFSEPSSLLIQPSLTLSSQDPIGSPSTRKKQPVRVMRIQRGLRDKLRTSGVCWASRCRDYRWLPEQSCDR